ncbi:MAG: hypothetical protein H0T62_10450 [Parachlamydiaceae bacterium]|nr:hypothetical protein [Parachlamydiaceae bacterium]
MKSQNNKKYLAFFLYLLPLLSILLQFQFTEVFAVSAKIYNHTALCQTFKTWDPDFQTILEANSEQIIDLSNEFKQFIPPEEVKSTLDTLITPEVYSKLINNDLNNDFLKNMGFQIFKEDETRLAPIDFFIKSH